MILIPKVLEKMRYQSTKLSDADFKILLDVEGA